MMNNNVYGIDLGTCNFKDFCKSTGKILKEKNTVAIINKNQIAHVFQIGTVKFTVSDVDVILIFASSKFTI